MLFLQFMLYSSFFVGALKNEIPEAVLELCQLKIKQLSPDILKFRAKHEDNPFTFNCSLVSRSFLFVFHAGSRDLDSNNSRNSSYKEKTAGSAIFLFLMTMVAAIILLLLHNLHDRTFNYFAKELHRRCSTGF